MIRPTVGAAPPVHATFGGDEQARQFWRLSYRAGRNYIRGRDALGGAVLVQHEREEADGYARRLRVTKARGYVGPILRRYLGLVWRRPPIRPAAPPPMYAELVADATGTGQSLDAVMRSALARAQVDRESYLVPGVQGAVEGVATVAQLQQTGTRPVVQILSASAVLNWEDEGGALEEILFLWHGETGKVLRWMGPRTFQDFQVEDGPLGIGKVKSAGPEMPHGYSRQPVVRLRPVWDPEGGEEMGSLGDSQAGPLAESQQAITNYLSLLNEEIYNVTFSQMVASGVSDSAVRDVKVGNCRVLCLPNPAARVDFIGADPAQAASIREALTDEVGNLFRLAGLSPGDPLASGQAVSGVALAWRASDMASIVEALAAAAEEAENALWTTLGEAWGFDIPAPTVYAADADLPDFGTEAATLLAIIGNASLPTVIRRKVAERFASRNLSLSVDEEKELAEEMTEDPAPARAAANAAASWMPGQTGARPPSPAPEDDAGEDDAEDAGNGAPA